eukprot:1933438-Pyramimonas_sp.AAC.1
MTIDLSIQTAQARATMAAAMTRSSLTGAVWPDSHRHSWRSRCRPTTATPASQGNAANVPCPLSGRGTWPRKCPRGRWPRP